MPVSTPPSPPARAGNLGLSLFMLLGLLSASSSMAATITVNAISAGCDLASAIAAADANVSIGGCTAGEASPVVDRIVFAESLWGQTLPQSTSYFPLSDMEIDGDFKITLSRQNPAGPKHRIFQIPAGITVTLRGLTITDGAISGGDEYGGTIENLGNLILDSCVITSSEASADGGAIANYASLTLLNSTIQDSSSGIWGGAIVNWGGELTLENSRISGNTASGDGGGIYLNGGTANIRNSVITGNFSGNSGGGLRNLATMTIEHSTVSGNSAINGGGIHNSGTMTLVASTVSENEAFGQAGGISAGSNMSISKSTISGNTAGSSAGGIASGAISIVGSTIVGNISGFEGLVAGLSVVGSGGTLVNTVIADNLAAGEPADCSLLSGWTRRSNWSGDGGCSVAEGFSGAPGLGPLADNGGATRTHLPLPGSGLLDAANFSDCTVSDQRGVDRPQDSLGGSGADCDIGAVERLDAPQALCALSDLVILPDMIDGSQQHFASETRLSTEGAVTVTNSADLALSAVQDIEFAPEFTVLAGGQLTLEVAAGNCN